MCKVLLVDDDAAQREALQAALISHGHDVVSAHDGIAALRVAIESKPDLIVSDVNMPHLEGTDAVRILKALPRFTRVPVILMSGAELPASSLVQAALRKPVPARILLDLVDTLGRTTIGPSCPQPARPSIHTDRPQWESTLAAMSLGTGIPAECAARICLGIELMHAQAKRIDRLRNLDVNTEESEQFYERIVQSIASLVQCLTL